MSRQKFYTAFFSSAIMFLLIIDSKTALLGAREGIDLCIRSVVPSLLPFIIVSIILTNTFSDISFRFLQKLFHVPKGTESIILSGLLGGYPIGAQCIGNAFLSKRLPQKDCAYLLTFCNQAGPSFIFGIVASYFPNACYGWALWMIQIVTSFMVAKTQSYDFDTNLLEHHQNTVTISDALRKAITSMSYICGWIISFKVLISIGDKWLLWLLPDLIKPIVFGFFELTNGLFMLNTINNIALRFIYASVLLAGGGLCVAMQTASVTGGLSLKPYLKGKLIQSVYSLTLSSSVVYLIEHHHGIDAIFALLIFISIIFFPSLIRKKQKIVAYKTRMVYNNAN